MFSISLASMNVWSDVIFMFVIISSPKLNNWIVSWDFVFVKSSTKRSSGFGFKSSCGFAWNVPFAGG